MVLAVLAAPLLLAAGCGDDDEGIDTTTTADEATTTTTGETPTTAGDAIALTQSCTNSEDGYSLDYPEGWFTNSGDVVLECRLFDATDLAVEPGTEPDAPVLADVEPVAFDVAAEPSRGEVVVSRREAAIAGHDAVRLETEATEDAPLREPGDRQVRWMVDVAGDGTFIATAQGTDSVEFARAAEVLDAMVVTLERTR